METRTGKTRLSVYIACPWCSTSRLYYVPAQAMVRPVVVECEADHISGCGKLFAYRVAKVVPTIETHRLTRFLSWEVDDDQEKN